MPYAQNMSGNTTTSMKACRDAGTNPFARTIRELNLSQCLMVDKSNFSVMAMMLGTRRELQMVTVKIHIMPYKPMAQRIGGENMRKLVVLILIAQRDLVTIVRDVQKLFGNITETEASLPVVLVIQDRHNSVKREYILQPLPS